MNTPTALQELETSAKDTEKHSEWHGQHFWTMIRAQKVYFLAAAEFPVGALGAWSSAEGDGGIPSGVPSASADGSVGVGSLQCMVSRSLELIQCVP